MLAILLAGSAYSPRPQVPTERPYVIEEVSFSSLNSTVQLAGELTTPYGNGSYPAVILLSGSGKQDRDETVLGHKPFLVISDYLTRMGFTVLRFHDKGVGKSTGHYETADLKDFADDAAGVYLWLEKQPHINVEKMGYLGHSEGGYIAPLSSLSKDSSFMVILAGSAKPLLPDVMISQAQISAQAQGLSTEEINDYKRQYVKLTSILKQTTSVDEAKQNLTDWLKTEGASNAEIKATLNIFANRWGIYFAKYDPNPALTAFEGPILALFGEKDVQVSARENAVFMEQTLSNHQSKVCILDNMNHLFQRSITGGIDEYHKISTTIDPEVSALISNWLNSINKTNERLLCSASFRETNKVINHKS
jgi:pimeloyl-ACP methyl ester carboxylesterase